MVARQGLLGCWPGRQQTAAARPLTARDRHQPGTGGRDETAADHQTPNGQHAPARRDGAAAPPRPSRPGHHPCQAAAAPTAAAGRPRSKISRAQAPRRGRALRTGPRRRRGNASFCVVSGHIRPPAGVLERDPATTAWLAPSLRLLIAQRTGALAASPQGCPRRRRAGPLCPHRFAGRSAHSSRSARRPRPRVR